MKYLKTYNELNKKINIKSLIQKFKQSSSKTLAKYIIITLLSVYSIIQIKNILNDQKEASYLFQQILTNIQLKILNNQIDILKNTKKSIFRNPINMKLSQDGWNDIKKEERLRLKAYSIGDGMSSVGWGHAEPLSTSKYSIGQIITKEEAQKLFITDINQSANDLRRLFRQWKEKGIIVHITQNQFDVMVSMIFNMGNNGFRRTNFIQAVKKNDMKKASELLKTTAINDKFPGLKKRRQREHDKFITLP